MYYVLFHWKRGRKAKDFKTCRSEQETIDFLHENYKEIEVYRIIETARSYQLGLIVTEELIKSVLEPKEEPEEEQPIGRTAMCKSTLESPRPLEEALESIEKKPELTPEEKTQAALDDADWLIEREKKRQEQAKKGWKLCTKCNSNRISPRNKTGICTPCQQSSEGKRKYTRRKT